MGGHKQKQPENATAPSSRARKGFGEKGKSETIAESLESKKKPILEFFKLYDSFRVEQSGKHPLKDASEKFEEKHWNVLYEALPDLQKLIPREKDGHCFDNETIRVYLFNALSDVVFRCETAEELVSWAKEVTNICKRDPFGATWWIGRDISHVERGRETFLKTLEDCKTPSHLRSACERVDLPEEFRELTPKFLKKKLSSEDWNAVKEKLAAFSEAAHNFMGRDIDEEEPPLPVSQVTRVLGKTSDTKGFLAWLDVLIALGQTAKKIHKDGDWENEKKSKLYYNAFGHWAFVRSSSPAEFKELLGEIDKFLKKTGNELFMENFFGKGADEDKDRHSELFASLRELGHKNPLAEFREFGAFIEKQAQVFKGSFEPHFIPKGKTLEEKQEWVKEAMRIMQFFKPEEGFKEVDDARQVFILLIDGTDAKELKALSDFFDMHSKEIEQTNIFAIYTLPAAVVSGLEKTLERLGDCVQKIDAYRKEHSDARYFMRHDLRWTLVNENEARKKPG